MTWRALKVADDATHHLAADGAAAYAERFDEVLKFHAPGLAPVSRAGRAWHIRVDGSPAYDRRFLRTFGFYDGRSAVVTADGWTHIDATGRDAYAARHAWCGNYQGNVCTVRDHQARYHHIRPDGEALYPQRWRYAGDFRDGLAVVQRDDGQSSHIDHSGKLLHGRWFLDLDVFHKAFARARDDIGWMHVDIHGVPAYRRRFAAVEPFYNGQARVERFDGALEVIDERGACVVELRPAAVADPLEGQILTRSAWGRVVLSPATNDEGAVVHKWTRHANEREVLVLRELDGVPGVPRLLGRHLTGSGDQLQLSYCSGSVLGDARSVQRREEAEAVRIACDVLRVCVALHARGWIHTDIHPGNVLDGDPATLLDYACCVRGTREAPWRGEMNWGVWVFAPPEQLADYSVLDPSVDVYAAATVCASMVHGAPILRVPIRPHLEIGGWPAVRDAMREAKSRLDLSHLSEPLRRALAPALAVSPGVRPTAAALLEALRHV